MLRSLHERGLNLNARAVIAGCQAFSPLQHAVRIGNLEACKTLREFPSLDTSLLTPAYRIHVLHSAIAQLDVEMLTLL
jgi:hypothetical protein